MRLSATPHIERMMNMPKRVSVTRESETGRNLGLRDNYTGANMNRPQFVQQIESGNYPHHHVRVINGVKTPVSNPDRSTRNNLG